MGGRVGCSVAGGVDVLDTYDGLRECYLVFILSCSGTDIQGKRWSFRAGASFGS